MLGYVSRRVAKENTAMLKTLKRMKIFRFFEKSDDMLPSF